MNSTSSATDPDWLVLPHQPIQELSDNLWRVEGSLPHFSLKRVMTVVRLRSGGLLIHSAIALDEASMKRLEAWGTPAILLIPHVRHRMDAPRFKQRYPSLRVFATPGALAKARAVVPVDGTYADVPPDPAFSLELLDGTAQAEGALVVHSSDGTTVVLNEVVFDLEPARSAFARAALKFAGFGPGPRVTPVVKIELVKDRAALAEHLRRLAALPDLVRVIVSHSRMSSGSEAARALRQAASSL
ncbi:MAG: hypothetical protein ABI488_24955 [Polyangiaceae bacterium]